MRSQVCLHVVNYSKEAYACFYIDDSDVLYEVQNMLPLLPSGTKLRLRDASVRGPNAKAWEYTVP